MFSERLNNLVNDKQGTNEGWRFYLMFDIEQLVDVIINHSIGNPFWLKTGQVPSPYKVLKIEKKLFSNRDTGFQPYIP